MTIDDDSEPPWSKQGKPGAFRNGGAHRLYAFPPWAWHWHSRDQGQDLPSARQSVLRRRFKVTLFKSALSMLQYFGAPFVQGEVRVASSVLIPSGCVRRLWNFCNTLPQFTSS